MLEIIFKVCVILLTVYLLTGFILSKICELKGLVWISTQKEFPEDGQRCLICCKDGTVDDGIWDGKTLSFGKKQAFLWRPFPKSGKEINRIIMNPFGFKKHEGGKKNG